MRLLAAALSALAAGIVASAPQDGGTRVKGAPDGGSPDGAGRKQRASKTRGPAAPARADKPIILGDQPGSLRNWTEAQKQPQPDAGSKQAKQAATVQELQQEIADLRARTAFLEKQASVSQEQTQVLQQMSQQLQELRSQMSGSEERRLQTERQRQVQRQQSEQAVERLVSAQNALASGSADVLDAFDGAEEALSPQARRDLGAARYAVQNHDLAAARSYLQSAIADAQAGR